MLAIINPPPPNAVEAANQTLVYGVGGTVVVLSVILLLWGRTMVGRAVLALAAAALAYLYGGLLTASLNVPPTLAKISCAFTAALLCVVAARIIWPLVLTGMIEALAVVLVICSYMSQMPDKKWPVFPAADEVPDTLAWLAAMWDYIYAGFSLARELNVNTMILVMAPAALLPLIVGLIYPRVAAIIASGIAGGLALTGAFWFLAVQVRPNLWPSDWYRLLIPGGVAAVLTIIGWIYQGHAEALAYQKKKQKPDDARPPENKEKREHPSLEAKSAAKGK